jgi:hypothetical protein
MASSATTGAASAAGLTALSARGQSANWVQAKKDVEHRFERFRNFDASTTSRYPSDIHSLDEETLTTMKGGVYEYFADFLVHHYIIEAGHKNAGKHLSYGVAANTFSTLLNIAKERFESSQKASTKQFFECLAPSGARTASGRWFLGIKHQIKKKLADRAMKAGDQLDQSATPLYEKSVRFCSNAYSLDGRAQAAAENACRKFSIITEWQCSGRSGELAFMDFDAMRYDPFYECGDLDLMQGKVPP